MKRLVSTAIVALFLIGIGSPAESQTAVPCAPGADFRTKLKTDFQEVPISLGLGNNGAIVEVFASPDRTFTIMMTAPDGTSCLLATGNFWESINKPIKIDGPKV